MKNYQKFAKIYDEIMGYVDYEGWAKYILEVIREQGIHCNRVLDLACGTGNTTIPLHDLGFDTIGIDLSESMLEIARTKNNDITFVERNMLNLDLEGKFDAIVSFQDGINYLVNDGELDRLCKEVADYLIDDALFIFDLNLVDKYGELSDIDDDVTIIDEDNFFMVYDSKYDKLLGLWEITVTGFIREDDKYVKFKETHKEKNYSIDEAKISLSKSGLSIVKLYDMFTFDEPSYNTRRVLVVAKKEI